MSRVGAVDASYEKLRDCHALFAPDGFPHAFELIGIVYSICSFLNFRLSQCVTQKRRSNITVPLVPVCTLIVEHLALRYVGQQRAHIIDAGVAVSFRVRGDSLCSNPFYISFRTACRS